MDIAVYLIAAAILIVLIVFALKVRGSTQEADEEQQRDVVRAAGPRQRAPEERGAGMPRRRRNLAASMANRRPQREDVENERDGAGREGGEEEDAGSQRAGEASGGRERAPDGAQTVSKSATRIHPAHRELQGGSPGGPGLSFWDEDAGRHLQTAGPAGSGLPDRKTAPKHDVSTPMFHRVIDDRGKFISITPDELDSVAQFMKKRGRVSITELAQASNSLINLTPESRSSA
ncbi:hypothetical protein JOQ06_000427 [Pogonophryne albipinna]|uniref:DDRGK domain-containing protein 1 n=1 Tax=Pogonophryne albipinna TaxID=1090488 RepID=A0AAD6AG63_9TELE|nr:hypothetical protein JOQ06_000427 [Pogonophryne albipinna]